jgi:hypothetical protein
LNADFFHKNEYFLIGGFLLSLLPVGVLVGLIFPYILERSAREKRPLVYAVDAACSTLGVSVALFISVFFGFRTNFLISTFSYIIVLLLFP